MADHEAIDRIVAERLDGWIAELIEFLAISSEAGDPRALSVAATRTADRLRRLGCEIDVVETTEAPPLVVGEIGSGPRVLTLVQHYDVQPAVPFELWTTPPYEPAIRDGRVWARGATDNKGEFMSRVWGVEAYLASGADLPCRVRFLVEGEEESGSRHLDALLDRRPSLRDADAALIEGGGLTDAGQPWIDCGVRGMLGVELVVRTAASDIHSSVAPLVPNAAARLASALASLRDPEGGIALDGFLDDVTPPSAATRASVRALPTDDLDAIRDAYGVRRFVLDREGGDALEALAFEPTVNIQGLWSGYTGPGDKTIVPAEAHARLDLRLVPDQDPDRVFDRLGTHLARRGFADVEMHRFAWGRPWWTPTDHPIVAAAAAASEAVAGRPAVVNPSMPGCAPMWQVCAARGVPNVSLGAGRNDCMAHAPDENYRISDAASAARMMGRFLDAFAGLPAL